ncbi:MAG TPA: LPXTG cell wall anchor domain-containing protein [Gemmatimonadales bacterium]|nr:LPXTG cell wall anchor domain-containing protein [Gemmatimonadales bacterium]
MSKVRAVPLIVGVLIVVLLTIVFRRRKRGERLSQR